MVDISTALRRVTAQNAVQFAVVGGPLAGLQNEDRAGVRRVRFAEHELGRLRCALDPEDDRVGPRAPNRQAIRLAELHRDEGCQSPVLQP